MTAFADCSHEHDGRPAWIGEITVLPHGATMQTRRCPLCDRTEERIADMWVWVPESIPYEEDA